MKKLLILSLLMFTVSCGWGPFKKDNKPKKTVTSLKQHIIEMRPVYQEAVKSQTDSYGLVTMDGGIGDSAAFSCLAMIGGGAEFDPEILLHSSGKLLRHPDISPSVSKAPTSKDMMNGYLWCLFWWGANKDKTHALDLVKRVISFGKSHSFAASLGGWFMCTSKDRKEYNMSNKVWLGRCLIAPAGVKDIYRVAKYLGYNCKKDNSCIGYSALGFNIPTDGSGFRRHLAVNTTVRNGLVEGAINDLSLRQLRLAAESNVRNSLYQAHYHLFLDGKQNAAMTGLCDDALFPRDRLPTSANYSTHYLFQRDITKDDTFIADGDGCINYLDTATTAPVRECGLEAGLEYTRYTYNDDWLPDNKTDFEPGRGVEWLFAAAVVLGDLPEIDKLPLKFKGINE